MEDEELVARIQAYRDDILVPLGKEKRFRETCDWIIATLETENDPDFRFHLIPDLCLHLKMVGDGDACRHWARALTEEFDDWPLAWTNMAIFGVGSQHQKPLNADERNQAFEYYKIALDRAVRKGEWVRYVLFDICRLLAAMEDYDQLAEYMNKIIADLENKREIDIPYLEADWLKRVPAGTIDENMRRSYEALLDADKARRRALKIDDGPPTRDELETHF